MDKKCFGVGLLSGVLLTFGLLLTQRLINKNKRAKQHVEQKEQIKQEEFESQFYQQLKHQQLARVIKYFGQRKFEKLQNSFVIVFGVGGVGSHVVNMLARSGVKRIRIVDFDRVSLSSLNRHSFAVREDVGTSKVQCIKKYVNKILPHIKIQTVQTYVTVQNASQLLSEPADYVVDCIDNLDAKVKLIQICKQKNIQLIVSGGAGMKSDPTRLQIRDISECKYDNLILRLKKELAKKGIKSGIKVAFSYQQAQKQLLPLNQDQQKNPESFKVFDNYRIRIIPVLGTMPAILGMSIASYVLCELADQPYKPFQTDYVKSSTLNKLYNQLIHDQKKRGIAVKDMEVDMEQVSILAKQVYKWRCLITDKKQTNPRLARWNPQKPSKIQNLVFMNKQSYQRHNKFQTFKQVEQYYSQQVKQRANKLLQYGKVLYQRGYMVFV